MKGVYSIQDTMAQAWYQLSLFHNDQAAQRMFLDLCKDPNTPVGAHPEDHILFALGMWDEQEGKLVSFDTPRSICHGQGTATVAGEPKINGKNALRKVRK